MAWRGAELHLIGGKDGPTMEVAVSRMRFIGNQLENGLRIVGLSASLANARDVGEWLGASSSCIFNFDPKVHSVAIQMQGFDQPTFHSRMLAMSKPTYQAIKNGSRGKPGLLCLFLCLSRSVCGCAVPFSVSVICPLNLCLGPCLSVPVAVQRSQSLSFPCFCPRPVSALVSVLSLSGINLLSQS